MALSSSDIQRIHSNKKATHNKLYYGDTGKVYIGTEGGRLQLVQTSESTLFKQITEIPEKTVQKAIESLSEDVTTVTTTVSSISGVTDNSIYAVLLMGG